MEAQAVRAQEQQIRDRELAAIRSELTQSQRPVFDENVAEWSRIYPGTCRPQKVAALASWRSDYRSSAGGSPRREFENSTGHHGARGGIHTDEP